jgi:HlyD family secretion protein
LKRRATIIPQAIIAIVIVAAILFIWSRSHKVNAAPDLPTATAKQGEFSVLVNCRGSLIAARKVDILAPDNVPDLRIVWLAPSGGAVKEGDVIIRFDASKLEQDLREKTQALRQAQASLDQAVAQENIDADKDRLDLSQTTADMEKARLEASKKAIVSTIQGDESTIDFHMAEQKVAVQKTTADLHKESNDAKIASQKRLRDQALAEVNLDRDRLGRMQIKTPISGIVTYQLNTTQSWVNAQNYKVGDQAPAGVTIAEIPDLNSLQMESKIDEEDRGRIAVGYDVNVFVDSLPEKVIHAKLTSISPLTEESFEEWPPVRTFRAFASIENPDPRLRPGMNAGAGIVERKIPNVVSVPSRALFTLEGKPTVYVKGPRQFAAVPVTIEARNPDQVAINGISNGTVVSLIRPEAEK